MLEILAVALLATAGFIGSKVWTICTNCIPTINRRLDNIERDIADIKNAVTK